MTRRNPESAMWPLFVSLGFFLFISLACIPFGRNDLSLLDRFKGIRRPTEHDNRGLE